MKSGDKTKVRRDTDLYAELWEGTKVFTFPILDFSKRDVNQYLREYAIKHNPVVDLIHMSGECLCGAFAHPGELEEIITWFPGVGRCLVKLQEKVNDAGFPWGWEDRPPKWWLKMRQGQQFLPGLEPPSTPESILCASCSRGRQEGE